MSTRPPSSCPARSASADARLRVAALAIVAGALASPSLADEERPYRGPPPEEKQLPDAMRAAADERPILKVGLEEGDILGRDGRALQAAIDYVGGLGGGTVEIGAGRWPLRDSLHLRSGVHLRGAGATTVLVHAPAARSRLALDGDFGEEQITLESPEGFRVGDGVTIAANDVHGFHVTVARITGRRGATLTIDVPLRSDCQVREAAYAMTSFPVISAIECENVQISDLAVDGNREHSHAVNGCRAAGIYLFRSHGARIERATVRRFHGDGISFQQSNDVQVLACIAEENASLGFHPGSGSQRPTVRDSIARRNDDDGLFLCWRVRHGVFEGNQLLENGRYGISIGHKDTDNLLARNTVRGNGLHGVFFRKELEAMSGHRNRLIENLIEDNGRLEPSAGICVRGATWDLVIEGNQIRDTRAAGEATQTTAIRIEESAGRFEVGASNRLEAPREIEDLRQRPSDAEARDRP